MKKEKNIFTEIFNYFDKFEDRTRGYLSRRPILYTFIGGVAIVMFWRGIWHTADLFPFLTGPVSIVISVVILLGTGLFVSYFVGDMIIISGLHKEKKMFEKTEEEIQKSEHVIDRLETKIDNLIDKVDDLEEIIDEQVEEKIDDKFEEINRESDNKDFK